MFWTESCAADILAHAPRDGRSIMLFDKDKLFVGIGHWTNWRGNWCWEVTGSLHSDHYGSRFLDESVLIYWSPLPELSEEHRENYYRRQPFDTRT